MTDQRIEMGVGTRVRHRLKTFAFGEGEVIATYGDARKVKWDKRARRERIHRSWVGMTLLEPAEGAP